MSTRPAMTETTPDYAELSRHLGALAYHIQQTGTADSQDAQTCLEVAEALRILLSNYKTAQANWELALERNAALIEHKRKQAEDIMTLGRLVYASSDPLITWMDRAEAAEARVKELELMLRSANSIQQKTSTSMTDWVRRAEAAEAKLAEAMKVIEPFAREAEEWPPSVMNSVVAGDYDHITVGHLRAARKFLKENGNGE